MMQLGTNKNSLVVLLSLAVMAIGGHSLAQAPYRSDGFDTSPPPENLNLDLPPEQTVANMLVLLLSPEHPKPGDTVTVEVKTISFDLGRSDIGWLENGKLTESGVGKTKHIVYAGATGSSRSVRAVVRSPDGVTYEQSITIRPASVDIIWETPSSVPPFYRGKALYSQFGTLTFIAIPEIEDTRGRLIDPRNVFYTWSKNNVVLGSLSGQGKNTLAINEPTYRTPFRVKVVAESRDSSYSAEGNVEVDTTNPETLVYENSPLYGFLFNRAVVGGFNLQAPEVTIETFPYFFNVKKKSDLTYLWSVNGKTASSFKGPFLTLRNVTGKSGTASVHLEVTNPTKSFEGTSAGFSVNFGGSK